MTHSGDDGKQAVLVIPGIGGHPRFHDGFLAALRDRYRVHTAPHVDFFAEPCSDWNRHVDHWLSQFTTAAAGEPEARPPAVVGISFGAHVGWDLWRRLPVGAMGELVLVSYWPLAGWQRRGLTGLRRVPKPGTAAVGTVSFRWSEWRATDRAALRRLRGELYDDEATARRRLFARLVSLADAPPAPPPRATPGVGFVYARKEWPLRAARRRGVGSGATVLVDGDHSVSLDGSAELAAAVDRLIGQRRASLPDPDGTHG